MPKILEDGCLLERNVRRYPPYGQAPNSARSKGARDIAGLAGPAWDLLSWFIAHGLLASSRATWEA